MADVQPPGGVCQCGGAHFHNDAHDSIMSDTEYVPIGENYKEAFQAYIDRTFRNL